MVVVTSRSELISFYLRRVYRETGSILDYPLSQGVGISKNSVIKIEGVEMRSDVCFDSKSGRGDYVSA